MIARECNGVSSQESRWVQFPSTLRCPFCSRFLSLFFIVVIKTGTSRSDSLHQQLDTEIRSLIKRRFKNRTTRLLNRRLERLQTTPTYTSLRSMGTLTLAHIIAILLVILACACTTHAGGGEDYPSSTTHRWGWWPDGKEKKASESPSPPQESVSATCPPKKVSPSPQESPAKSPKASKSASPQPSQSPSPPPESPSASPLPSPPESPSASPLPSPPESPSASPLPSPPESPSASPLPSPPESPSASPLPSPPESPSASPLPSPPESPSASPLPSPPESPSASPLPPSPPESPPASPSPSPPESPSASPLPSPPKSPSASPQPSTPASPSPTKQKESPSPQPSTPASPSPTKQKESPSPPKKCPCDCECECECKCKHHHKHSPSPSPEPECPSPSPSPEPECPSPSPSPEPECPSPSPEEMPSPSPILSKTPITSPTSCPPDNPRLPQAARFSAFILGNTSVVTSTGFTLDMVNGLFDAAAAVQNGLRMRSFSVNRAATCDSQEAGLYTLIVDGGSLDYANGQLFCGNLLVSPDVEIRSVPSLAGGSVKVGNVAELSGIDFEEARSELLDESESLCSMVGSTDVTPAVVDASGGITFTSSGRSTEQFMVRATDLSRATNIRFVGFGDQSSDEVIVNVMREASDPETAMSISNVGINLGGVSARTLLWNICGGTEIVRLEAVSLPGSLLAASADVTLQNGQVQGQVVARTLSGSGGGQIVNPPCA